MTAAGIAGIGYANGVTTGFTQVNLSLSYSNTLAFIPFFSSNAPTSDYVWSSWSEGSQLLSDSILLRKRTAYRLENICVSGLRVDSDLVEKKVLFEEWPQTRTLVLLCSFWSVPQRTHEPAENHFLRCKHGIGRRTP